MADAKVYKNFIGGEWVDSVTGKTFENRNPADKRELLGHFQASGEEDVKRAVDVA
ncbi:MAG: aldehyde dehydrogenase, partial [Armatimonadetes bacterium]|nr:aldehyde dehydrogenase [Armatimonadota bacterium]NIO98663.1 aldehyde dehydrogenase [Armatimonadota bacterium]